MADAQAAPKKGMNPILKWLLIGCGTIVLLMIVAMVSCFVLLKKKVYDPAAAKMNEAKTELAKQGIEVDTSNGVVAGIQSATNQGIVKSMVAEGQGVIAALPVPERPAAEAAYKALDAKKAQMSAEDMADLIKAHAAYQQAMMANIQNATSGRPKPMDPEASRALVKQVQEIALRH